MFESIEEVDQIETEPKNEEAKQVPKMPNGALQNDTSSPDSGHPSSRNFSVTSGLSDGSLSTEDSTAPEAAPRSAAITQPPQSLVKPAGAKGASLPEESSEDHEVKKEKEPEVTNTAEKSKVESMIQPLEEGWEKKSETKETVERSGAIQKTETDELKTSKPEVLLLVEEKENVPSDHVGRGACFTPQRDEAQVMTESDESPSAIEMEEIPKAKVSMVPWSRKGCCEATPLPDVEFGHVEEQGGKPSPEGTESIVSEEPEMERLYTNLDFAARSESAKGETTTGQSTGFSVSTLMFTNIKRNNSYCILFIHLFILVFCVSARAFRLVHLKPAPYRKGRSAL